MFVAFPYRDSVTGFFASGFFHESSSPKPQIFSKIRRDIHKSRGTTGVNEASGKPPVSTTPAANFATGTAGVVDTGGKFVTGVNNTGGKFAASVNINDGKMPQVTTTLTANNGNNIRLLTP